MGLLSVLDQSCRSPSAKEPLWPGTQPNWLVHVARVSEVTTRLPHVVLTAIFTRNENVLSSHSESARPLAKRSAKWNLAVRSRVAALLVLNVISIASAPANAQTLVGNSDQRAVTTCNIVTGVATGHGVEDHFFIMAIWKMLAIHAR